MAPERAYTVLRLTRRRDRTMLLAILSVSPLAPVEHFATTVFADRLRPLCYALAVLTIGFGLFTGLIIGAFNADHRKRGVEAVITGVVLIVLIAALPAIVDIARTTGETITF